MCVLKLLVLGYLLDFGTWEDGIVHRVQAVESGRIENSLRLTLSSVHVTGDCKLIERHEFT